LEEMGKLFGGEAKPNIYNQDQPASHISSDEEKARDNAGMRMTIASVSTLRKGKLMVT
jgi:hypothetical protein